MDYSLRVEYDEYVVKKGDSLYKIAKEFNSTVTELLDINMLTTNVIYPNQVLIVPKLKKEEHFDNEYYITKENDTVKSICKKYNIKPYEFGKYNDFGELFLSSGQKIYIPNNVYIVKDEDTIDSVLRNTKKTAEEILSLNSDKWLQVGSRINLE